MAFLRVNTQEVTKEGGSDYIKTSGIYSVTMKHAEATTTKNGAVQVNYFFDKAMSYGNTVIGVNGQPVFGYRILEALATVLGHDELSDAEPTTVTFKKGAKELNCIPELNDIEVKAWIQFKYRMTDTGIREDVAVKRFYRTSDNASGQEIAILAEGGDATIGDRFTKDSEKASEIIYGDGVTEESVRLWKESESKGGGASAPAKTPAAAKSGFPGKAKSGFPGAA